MMAKQRPLLLLLLMLMTATLKFTGSFCGAEEPTRRYDYAYRIDDFAASVAADRANIASTASCDVPDKREEPQFVRLNKSGRNSSLIVSVTNFIAELELVDTDNRLKEIRRQQTLRIGPQYDLAGCELPYVCTKSPETMKRSEKNKTECVNAMERRVCRDDHSMIMATSFDQPRKVDLLVSCGVMRTCAFRKLSDFSQRYVDPGDENPDRYVCENSQKLVKKDDKKVGSADEDDENEEGDEGGGGSRMLVRRSTPEEVEQPQLIEPELFDETRFMMSPDVHSIEDWEYMWVGENGRGVRTYRTDADGPYQLVDDAITYMNLGVNTVLKIFVDDVYQYVVYTSDQNATHVYRVCLRSLHGYLKLDGLDGQKAGRSSLNDVTLSCPAVDGEHSGGAFDAHYVDGRIILFYQLYNGEIAVCQHDLIGLNDYIVEGRHRCAQQDTDDLLLYGRASCEGFKDIWVDCGPSFEGRISRFAYQATFPFSQIEPLPSIRSSRIAVPNGEMATSFQTFVFKQKLYTFVGTDSGNAFKFILDGARATLAEKVIISDEAVTQITSVNAARADTTGEAEVIVALTKTRVSTFKAESCESLYSDCQSCMKSRDPFCGWCIYQAR